jgi:hypothetical protein
LPTNCVGAKGKEYQQERGIDLMNNLPPSDYAEPTDRKTTVTVDLLDYQDFNCVGKYAETGNGSKSVADVMNYALGLLVGNKNISAHSTALQKPDNISIKLELKKSADNTSHTLGGSIFDGNSRFPPAKPGGFVFIGTDVGMTSMPENYFAPEPQDVQVVNGLSPKIQDRSLSAQLSGVIISGYENIGTDIVLARNTHKALLQLFEHPRFQTALQERNQNFSKGIKPEFGPESAASSFSEVRKYMMEAMNEQWLQLPSAAENKPSLTWDVVPIQMGRQALIDPNPTERVVIGDISSYESGGYGDNSYGGMTSADTTIKYIGQDYFKAAYGGQEKAIRALINHTDSISNAWRDYQSLLDKLPRG